MSTFSQSPAQNFFEWIEMATRAIAAPDEQARFRAEIETHYAAAVARHLQAGLSAPAAQAAALADLGTPAAATLRFKQERLTETDARCALQNLSRARSKIWLGAQCLLIPLFLFCGLRVEQDQFPALSPWFWAFFLLSSLAWITLRMVIYRVARRDSTLATVRQILLLEGVAWSIFGLDLWALSLSGKSSNEGLLILFALFFFQRLQLHRKLQSAGEDWSALPPSPPVAS